MDFCTLDLNIIDRSTDCISVYDEDLNIKVWNKAVEKKYGIGAAEAIGENLFDLFPHVKDDYRVRCMKEALAVNKNFYFTGLPYVYGNGTYTQVILPFENSSDERFVMNVVRDHSPNERILRADMLRPLFKKSNELACAKF